MRLKSDHPLMSSVVIGWLASVMIGWVKCVVIGWVVRGGPLWWEHMAAVLV